ncbi:hypothetical protein BD779DRAFT_1576540 [Infundibulicybe gibba]|nr:hypothetical protein BD779DRAFT_1576540 [Infundibulicybe gibba]
MPPLVPSNIIAPPPNTCCHALSRPCRGPSITALCLHRHAYVVGPVHYSEYRHLITPVPTM